MKTLSISFLICLSLSGVAVHAQEKTETNINAIIPNPFACRTGNNCTLTDLFTAIAEKILLPIGGVIAVLAFIWSGFMFVTAQGDEKKITDARTALLYTAVGTLILLGATVIAKVLETTVQSLEV
jgi:hypothetical protein